MRKSQLWHRPLISIKYSMFQWLAAQKFQWDEQCTVPHLCKMTAQEKWYNAITFDMTLLKIDLIVLILLLHEATLVVQTHLQLNYVRFNIVATSIMIIIILPQVLYVHYDCFSSLYSKVWTDWLQSVLSSSVQFPRDITNMLLIWLSQSML